MRLLNSYSTLSIYIPATTRKELAMSRRPFRDKTYGDPEFRGAHRVVAKLQKHAAQCDSCTHGVAECLISGLCIFEEEKEKKTLPPNFSISFIVRPGLHKL